MAGIGRACLEARPALGLILLCFVGYLHAATPAEGLPGVSAETTVLRSLDDAVSGYSVVLSSAEKTGLELLVKNSLTVTGERSRRLWQWPKGAVETKVFSELSAQLAGRTLFECEGADCGRSNVWSTLVFGEALIYGPSRYQHYRVIRDDAGNVHVLYVVRRGNRRVHALYEFITDPAGSARSVIQVSGVLAALAATGLAPLQVAPEADGSLADSVRTRLEGIGAQLAGFGAGEIYAVCHLYPTGLPRTVGGSRKERGARAIEVSTTETVEELVAASDRCGEAAATALQAGLEAALLDGVAADSKNRQRPEAITFKWFGVGPLQPGKTAVNRIELVVPSRQLRE